MKQTPEYKAFHNAKQRCTNINRANYKYWGGRGIEFRFTSFQQFAAELGPKPKGTTLDRINNNGHYEPGNVRWATWREQIYNRHPLHSAFIGPRFPERSFISSERALRALRQAIK